MSDALTLKIGEFLVRAILSYDRDEVIAVRPFLAPLGRERHCAGEIDSEAARHVRDKIVVIVAVECIELPAISTLLGDGDCRACQNPHANGAHARPRNASPQLLHRVLPARACIALSQRYAPPRSRATASIELSQLSAAEPKRA